MPSVSLSSENVVPEKARAVAAGQVPPEVSVSMVVAAASCPDTCTREGSLWFVFYAWNRVP